METVLFDLEVVSSSFAQEQRTRLPVCTIYRWVSKGPVSRSGRDLQFRQGKLKYRVVPSTRPGTAVLVSNQVKEYLGIGSKVMSSIRRRREAVDGRLNCSIPERPW